MKGAGADASAATDRGFKAAGQEGGWTAPVILEVLILERMGAMPAQRRYPEELRERAVKMVLSAVSATCPLLA
jgi:hypothetical protein